MHLLWKQCDDDDHVCFKLAEIPWLTGKMYCKRVNVLQRANSANMGSIQKQTNKKM